MWAKVLAAVFVLALILLWKRDTRRAARDLPLPPGPVRLPIIGNLLDMPTRRIAPALRDLGQKYGDMTYLDMFGQPMIILNSYESATAILEGRSLNTSDRPQFVMPELAGFGWIAGLLGYAEPWRQRRRAFHGTFQPSTISKHRPAHIRACRRFLQRLLDTPADFLALTRYMFGAMTMDIVYGIAVADTSDPYIKIAERAAKVFHDVTVPGRYVVELVPALKHLPSWLPGMGFKRKAIQWRVAVDALRNVPYEACIANEARGDARDSMLASLIQGACREGDDISAEDDELFRDVTGLAYITGADTTLASLKAFFLAMVLEPHAQRKAQEELDAIVGPDRLPGFSDRDSLRYVNALVKEVIRWHSVVPLGISHRSMEEDEWNGYRIPAGCVLVPNQWAMSRDPAVYPDPDRFNPERFLQDQGGPATEARDPEKYQFGFGRRICPGRHFANDSLFITVASVLHVFNIEAPIGKDGKPVQVEPTINLDHFLSYPEPFECKIKPRSERAEALIKKSGRMDVLGD
ncbi:O-methylsterigmatocystin oxidoreductase [Trametes punicea]|nr:O-methylsterigmatocystin oxidoreductase [Trametes punicea]